MKSHTIKLSVTKKISESLILNNSWNIHLILWSEKELVSLLLKYINSTDANKI